MPTIQTSRGPVSTGDIIHVTAKSQPSGLPTLSFAAGLRFDDTAIVAVSIVDLTFDQLTQLVRHERPLYVTNLEGVVAIFEEDTLIAFTADEYGERTRGVDADIHRALYGADDTSRAALKRLRDALVPEPSTPTARSRAAFLRSV